MSDDKIIKKLFEHDERFEKLENGIEDGFKDVLNKLERITGIVQKLDQEQIFTSE